MFSALRGLVLFALTAVLAVPLAIAQPEPKPEPAPTGPTADDVKVLKEKFQTERDQAVKAKFPPDTLTKADELAKRAEEALKTENFKVAARNYRDARWQLPYLPPGLPTHVTRVLGESRMRHADRVNAL